MAFLKDDLIRNIKSVNPDKYVLKYYAGVIVFERTCNKTTKRIYITFKEFYPHSVIFNSLRPSVFINEIEIKLKNETKKLGLTYNSLDTFDFGSRGSNLNYSIMDKEVENDKNFIEIKPNIEFIIENDCLPFFEKYQDLNNVAELLSKLKPQEVVPYIQGAKLFCKTILILKEANHPKYEEKRDEFYEVLKKQALKKEVYAEQLRLFEALFFS